MRRKHFSTGSRLLSVSLGFLIGVMLVAWMVPAVLLFDRLSTAVAMAALFLVSVLFPFALGSHSDHSFPLGVALGLSLFWFARQSMMPAQWAVDQLDLSVRESLRPLAADLAAGAGRVVMTAFVIWALSTLGRYFYRRLRLSLFAARPFAALPDQPQ